MVHYDPLFHLSSIIIIPLYTLNNHSFFHCSSERPLLLGGGMWSLYAGFLKCWYPTTMGFPTKNDQHLGCFDVFWGYRHLRKHPYNLNSKIPTAKSPRFWSLLTWKACQTPGHGWALQCRWHELNREAVSNLEKLPGSRRLPSPKQTARAPENGPISPQKETSN